jgi:hypothetical protein
VNRYDDPRIRSLNYCANDAREIIASFKAQEGRRYAKVNSLLIADGETRIPDRKTIRDSLQFLAQADRRDIILLFLAGHGISGGNGGDGGYGGSQNDDGSTMYYFGGGGGGGGGSSGISETLLIAGGRAPAGDGGAVEIYKVEVYGGEVTIRVIRVMFLL